GDRRVRRARRAARGGAAPLRRAAAAILRRRRAARRGGVSRPRRDPARTAPRLHPALGRGAGVVDAAAGAVPLTLSVQAAIRLDTFLAAGILFLTTTRVEEVAYALGRLGVPYTVGFTLTLSFRLVPVFFDAALAVVQAQRCRGLELGRGGIVARLRRFVPI